MYALKNDTVVKGDCKNLIRLGVVNDVRIAKIEEIVAAHFGVNKYDLNTFYKDTPAKLMVCFLLHDMLHYSVPSIAKQYKIYGAFLQKNITEHYHKCLLDKAFFKLVTQLKHAFLYDNEPAVIAQ